MTFKLGALIQPRGLLRLTSSTLPAGATFEIGLVVRIQLRNNFGTVWE